MNGTKKNKWAWGKPVTGNLHSATPGAKPFVCLMTPNRYNTSDNRPEDNCNQRHAGMGTDPEHAGTRRPVIRFKKFGSAKCARGCLDVAKYISVKPPTVQPKMKIEASHKLNSTIYCSPNATSSFRVGVRMRANI